MSEFIPSPQASPLPPLTEKEVDELAQKIEHCPDILMRLEVDTAEEATRSREESMKRLVNAALSNVEDLFDALPSEDELRESFTQPYIVRPPVLPANPAEANDPDF